MSTQTVSTFFALSAIVILAMAFMLAAVWAVAGRSGTAAGWRDTVVASLGPRSLTYAWVVAVTATLGSLYYSEIADFIPCEFCWYQRIAMYPLAVVLGIAAYRRDRAFWRYGLPVVAIGSALSVYHYLIQWFPGLAASSCSATAPCTGRWVWEFGLVSIPFMALACFVAIGWLLIIGRTAAANSD